MWYCRPSPHCRPSPRKICNGIEKPLQTFPHCRSSPRYHFNRHRFYLYIFILIVAILWKIPVFYITEYTSFIIKRQILHVQSFIKITYPFYYIFENKNPELNKNGGRSAMLQIFLRGRYVMKGGRSAMLQTFPLGGRSAMLQIFRGKVCNVADLPGEGLQYNTGFKEIIYF